MKKGIFGKVLKAVIQSTKGKMLLAGGLLSLLGIGGDILTICAELCPDPDTTSLEVGDNVDGDDRK